MREPLEGLLADVEEMTRQAAVDGLTLASVYADVRLVLDLEPADDLPPEVLRACAVAWSAVHRELDRGSGSRVLGWDELEDRLWGATAGPGAELPGWCVLVEAGAPAAADAAEPRPGGLLSPEDLVRGAADLLASRLGGSAEHVALVTRPGSPPGPVVALVDGDRARAERACSWVRDLAPGSAGLTARAHRLAGHPDGLLGALRELAATSG